MLREDSSDNDDDNVALVDEHEVKPLSPSRRHNQFTALEISNDLNVRIARALSSHRWRWYLLAICLPLVLILVFFSLKLGRLFGDVTIICADTTAGQRMRDAELRALFLLRNQKRGLLHLWNWTDLRSNPSSTAITPSASNCLSSPLAESDSPGATVSNSQEAFKSAIMDLVKFNELAQAALLSTLGSINNSLNVMDDNVDAYSSSSKIDACPKVDPPAHRRTIEWKPKENRFLFAICLSGQMSNHLICLEKHMFFSALLGRVLVLPSIKVDYDYSRVLNIDHINQCLGREVVISFDDFVAKMKIKLKIDRFICYIASPQCFLDEEHIKRLKNLGISLGKFELAWPEDAKITEQRKRVVADIVSKFSSDDEVIAIGDMFYADVEEEWVKQPGGPIGHKCKALIQPNQLINRSAQQFVQTFLGSNFIALHFRRHGFLKFW